MCNDGFYCSQNDSEKQEKQYFVFLVSSMNETEEFRIS